MNDDKRYPINPDICKTCLFKMGSGTMSQSLGFTCNRLSITGQIKTEKSTYDNCKYYIKKTKENSKLVKQVLKDNFGGTI